MKAIREREWIVRDGYKTFCSFPKGTKILSMAPFKGGLIVATSNGGYIISKGGKKRKLKV